MTDAGIGMDDVRDGSEHVATVAYMRAAPLPHVVSQAMDDFSLPPTARLMMWTLAKRLDFVYFTAVKSQSLAHEMRIRENTAAQYLSLLVQRGYIEESKRRRPRAFRMPWSRQRHDRRAA